MTVTGSLLTGTLLATAIGSLAAADGLSIVLTSGLLGMGVLFFSSLFFRNGRSGDAAKDIPTGNEAALPEKPANDVATGEELLGFRLLRLRATSSTAMSVGACVNLRRWRAGPASMSERTNAACGAMP